MQPTVPIAAAADMEPALQANATVRLGGRAKVVARWTNKSTSVYQAVRNMVPMTWNRLPASARSTGLESIARNRAAALSADHMEPANRVVASQY